jgi:MFS family permease
VSYRDSLAVLREHNFRWFFLSRFVNIIGTSMSNVALAFAVLQVSDSASAMGQVLAAHTIPMVLFLLLAGVIADRFPRTLVLQVSRVTSFVTQGLAAYLVISGQAQLWELIVLEAANGVTSAMSFPAMQGIIPSLVGRGQLQAANALMSLSLNALTILGPSVAAVLVASVGPGWALGVDAATWIISAVLLVPVRLPARVVTGASSALADLREGWTFFRTTTWLWVVVAAFGVLNAIQTGGVNTLGPVIAKHTFGVRGWGIAMSAQAVGALLMSFVMLRVRLTRPLRAGMVGMVALGLPLFVLGFTPHTVPLVVATFLTGAGVDLFGLGWNLAMMEQVPEEMQARAWSYDSLGSYVAMPVGQLLYGPLGSWLGERPVLGASAVLYVVICLVTLAVPAVWGLRRARLTERVDDQAAVEATMLADVSTAKPATEATRGAGRRAGKALPDRQPGRQQTRDRNR